MNSVNRSTLIPYLCLGAVCIIWGTTYLALRVGVTQFPPFLFSMLRFTIAGATLIGLVTITGKVSFPGWQNIRTQAVGGLLMQTLGISMVGWAEMYVSSGLAAIICSLMPVWIIIINLLVSKDDRPNWVILAGITTGLLGIVTIFSEHLSEFSNQQYAFGIMVVFLGNMSWAIGSVWIKKKNETTNPFLNAGLQMFFGGMFLIPVSLIFDNYENLIWSNEVVFALGYLIILGSVAGYACFSYAMKKLPMTIVSLYAYINPIVAVVVGALILDEKLNAKIGIAILITVAGIYIVNKGYQMKNTILPLFGRKKSPA